MRGIFIGLGLFLLAVVVGVAYWYEGNHKTLLTIKGIVGSEKSNFLENPRVRSILETKYGLKLDYTREGSIEMVSSPVKDDIDFLWPSSQVALELFKNTQSNRLIQSELVFNSPVVLYSWDIVVKALVAQGLVKVEDSVAYLTDMDKLIRWELTGKSWPDIGLPDLYGKVNVITTDPTKSNTGNLYAGLMANFLSPDGVNDPDSVDRILPSLQKLFTRQGFMQSSSGFLFEQFLQTGVGQYPLIADYENQIVEFSLQHPDFWPKVKDKIKIVYPVPTVWSEHPVLILNKKALPLLDALKDPEIQRIAWEEHGFRTGLIGVQNDPKVIKVDGLARSINKTMPMPRAAIMEKIINALNTNNQ
ncbi:substrate-binding domain-containing protein [Puia dinghuensis]|uniref:Extracellular solute-binding protein n=1 Tax=Puia dinghuensis TaxID=1792502 RepID=A0A8J2UDK0_9BACT|nr:substrate-binding domain-containing protein [Puia dinghuensis]GGB03010.1 hypothetical protein GCM10011511_27870 [Puia dinghuensis]